MHEQNEHSGIKNVAGSTVPDTLRLARHTAADRCVDAFRRLFEGDDDPEAAAKTIEDVFFDNGYSEARVLHALIQAREEFPSGYKITCVLDETDSDSVWIADAAATGGFAEACDCVHCSASSALQPMRTEALQCAQDVLRFCSLYLTVREPDLAIDNIFERLSGGWAPEQLVRAARGYREYWPSRRGTGMMNAEEFFDARFDRFCKGRDFVDDEHTYSVAVERVPWYPAD